MEAGIRLAANTSFSSHFSFCFSTFWLLHLSVLFIAPPPPPPCSLPRRRGPFEQFARTNKGHAFVSASICPSSSSRHTRSVAVEQGVFESGAEIRVQVTLHVHICTFSARFFSL